MINVGVTNIKKEELNELNSNPPNRVRFSNIKTEKSDLYKGFNYFSRKVDVDLIESTGPCIAQQEHVQRLSTAIFGFSILGNQMTRKQKLNMWRKMALRENCRKIMFKSMAAYNMLTGYRKYFGYRYGKIRDKEILDKTEITYPGVKHIQYKKKNKDEIKILFAGNFFYREGGEQVVNAFRKLQGKYDNIKLVLYSWDIDRKKHYSSINDDKIMERISRNKAITMISSSKGTLFDKHLETGDIFVRPTIKDHDGFSLLNPMNFSMPVISTDFFAIPEIVENNKEGLLIRISNYNYVLNEIGNKLVFSKSLDRYLEAEVYKKLKQLVDDNKLRLKLGRNANKKVESKFSIEKRNRQLKRIYEEAASKNA